MLLTLCKPVCYTKRVKDLSNINKSNIDLGCAQGLIPWPGAGRRCLANRLTAYDESATY